MRDADRLIDREGMHLKCLRTAHVPRARVELIHQLDELVFARSVGPTQTFDDLVVAVGDFVGTFEHADRVVIRPRGSAWTPLVLGIVEIDTHPTLP